MEHDPTFSVISVEHVYTVLDSRWMAIRTTHRFTLEALQRSRFFLRSYTWDNAVGIEKPPIILSGRNQSGTTSHRIQGPVILGEKGKRLAVVDLGRVFEKGEQEFLEIEHFFVRTRPDDSGFVGHAALPGCREITLRAYLPARDDLRPCFKSGYTETKEWKHTEPLSSAPSATSPRLEVKHKVPNPVAGMRYRITWDQNRSDT
ncbi:hypothetical protein [Paenarthrobacter nitroguajacolicus]|uniref:hypothetical protein n=1 Tax=Paenarthrobacter nitroguajacolicus TaxID=211146 RepID=UPI003439C572